MVWSLLCPQTLSSKRDQKWFKEEGPGINYMFLNLTANGCRQPFFSAHAKPCLELVMAGHVQLLTTFLSVSVMLGLCIFWVSTVISINSMCVMNIYVSMYVWYIYIHSKWKFAFVHDLLFYFVFQAFLGYVEKWWLDRKQVVHFPKRGNAYVHQTWARAFGVHSCTRRATYMVKVMPFRGK